MALALKVPVFFVITKVRTLSCNCVSSMHVEQQKHCIRPLLRHLCCAAQVDICPEHVLKHTLSSLQLILRKPGVKKRPFMVRTQADVLTCARHIDSDALAPIFLTSSVTGTS